MKKQILLASLLSVGILSVTQPAQAFKPGSSAELKAEAKVDAKVTIYKNEDGKPAGFKLEALDPALAEEIMENVYKLLDEHDAYYTSEDDEAEKSGGTDGGSTGSTGGDTNDGGKKDGPKESPAPCDDCWTEDADGKLIYHLDLDKKTDSKGGYEDSNPVGDGTDDGTDLEKSWKRGTK